MSNFINQKITVIEKGDYGDAEGTKSLNPIGDFITIIIRESLLSEVL